MRATLGRDVVSGRRACRMIGQASSAQRRERAVAHDEERLRHRTVELAREYGRYGYRRVTAVPRTEGS